MKRPVLIMGFIPRIVIPIARSLHRRGIQVDVADFLQWPRPRSCAICEFVRLPNPYLDPAGFASNLRNFIGKRRHDMLVPVDDYALAAVAQHYDVLNDLLQIACPPPHIVHLILNKAATLEVAQRCGVCAPKTVVVSNSAQLPELLRTLPLPWILKPVEKHQRYDEFKSCMLTTPDEVEGEFPKPCEFSPPMMLQEYCPGVGVGVEMLLHQGECLAVFQHRRLKELPYGGGVAVTAVAESPDPALVQSSLALLRALQWEGVAMVEFKVNPVDGQAVLMEVNGRYWGTISLPIIAGIDFPLYHWQLLHGEVPEVASAYAVGAKWRWTVGYIARIHALLAAAGHSKGARKALFRTLLDSPEDFSDSFFDSLMTSSDPMAAVFDLLRALRYYIVHDAKMLFKRSERVSSDSRESLVNVKDSI